jgi:hypothetical protein
VASAGHAQRGGFAIGIAPVIHSPVQPFVTSPVMGFGTGFVTFPAITPPIVSTFVSPSHFNVGAGFAPVHPIQPLVHVPAFVPHGVFPHNNVTIIAPGNTVVAPHTTVITPNAVVVAPATTVVGTGLVSSPGSVIVRGGAALLGHHPVVGTVNPVVVGGPIVAPPVVSPVVPGSVFFPAGTPRAQVIGQLGPPLASVVTRDREILGFGGGVTVIIQNGIVVVR